MKPTVKILCLSRALAPITHQSGTVGNESVLNDEPVRTPLGVRRVPVLSGNCIRHRCVREPAASHLVESWGLAGGLTKDELNLLYHGGLRREAANRVSLARTAEMERLIPLFRLLGVCLPDDIYPGSLNSLRAMLVCRENEPRIRAMAPAEWFDGELSLAPASSFVARWQYVRGDVRITAPHMKPTDAKAIDADEKLKASDMMPFAGTCVMAGAEWLHGFVVRHADDLLLGCLFSALERWQADGGTVGGMIARGHGRLEMSVHAPDVDQERCIDAYREHVEKHRETGTAFLHTLFDAAPKRKPKQKELAAAVAEGGDDD